jgi:hypothetical protein
VCGAIGGLCSDINDLFHLTLTFKNLNTNVDKNINISSNSKDMFFITSGIKMSVNPKRKDAGNKPESIKNFLRYIFIVCLSWCWDER